MFLLCTVTTGRSVNSAVALDSVIFSLSRAPTNLPSSQQFVFLQPSLSYSKPVLARAVCRVEFLLCLLCGKLAGSDQTEHNNSQLY